MSSYDQRRALRAAAPVAGLLAAGLLVWQGSSAAFSATTSNTADSWSTGSLVLANNGGGTTYAASTTALFGAATAANLKPGSTGTQCLTVQSGGTVAGALKFYRGATITGSAGLAGQIQLTIDAVGVGAATNIPAACTGFPATGLTNLATNVALSALPTTYAGAATSLAVAAGTQRVAYRFAWTFVSTGNNASDNALQGTSASTEFDFEIQ